MSFSPGIDLTGAFGARGHIINPDHEHNMICIRHTNPVP